MIRLARSIALVALLAAGNAYALEEFGSCLPSETANAGTVESVREVAAPRDIHAFDPDVLEHRVRPDTTEVVVVRLDAGPVVVLDQSASGRLHAGQRVRVTSDGTGFCPAPLAGLAQRLF
jgi:hypothetical protein